MAASTSTAANPNNSDYDVFISHRGTEVKKTFASHLYRRLLSFGLRVFLDQPELKRGDFTKSQIESAIRAASVQVAIFSPAYADSDWCLNELVSMSETLETGATVIPVFYKVEPWELRWTRGNDGTYAKALQRLEKETTDEPQAERKGENLRHNSITIEKWRNALSLVAEISGFELEACNGDKGELVDKIVERVSKLVKRTGLMNAARYPTGLDEKVKHFENAFLLQRIGRPHGVGIVGLGGVGKTTLAKELFSRKRSYYQRSFFLSAVRENAVKGSLPFLQRQLVEGSLGGSHVHTDSLDQGMETLIRSLSSCKFLLILADIDNEDQLDALLPVQLQDVLYPTDTLVLITSRDKDVLTRSGVKDSAIYHLTGLNTQDSRDLFCSHAFGQRSPLPGFESLVDKFLKACNGLPLSLKVFESIWGTFKWKE